MRLCTEGNQRVLDLCLTHTISGVGTEQMCDGKLYPVTTSAGCQLCRSYGFKVSARRCCTQVTMWLSSVPLVNTPISLRISAQMDFWSRCPGHDNACRKFCRDCPNPAWSGPGQSWQNGSKGGNGRPTPSTNGPETAFYLAVCCPSSSHP